MGITAMVCISLLILDVSNILINCGNIDNLEIDF